MVPLKPDSIEFDDNYAMLTELRNLDYLYNCLRDGPVCPSGGLCCKECRENYGYLEFIKESDLDTYVKAFDEETGFLGENGCRLPKRLRSVTCITHMCRRTKNCLDATAFQGAVALKFVMLRLEASVRDI